jgi:hypothetical protein
MGLTSRGIGGYNTKIKKNKKNPRKKVRMVTKAHLGSVHDNKDVKLE